MAFERLRAPILYAIIAEGYCKKNNRDLCETWIKQAFTNGFAIDENQFMERFPQVANAVKDGVTRLFINEVEGSWSGNVRDHEMKNEFVTVTLPKSAASSAPREAIMNLQGLGCSVKLVGGGRWYNTGVFYAEESSKLKCTTLSGFS